MASPEQVQRLVDIYWRANLAIFDEEGVRRGWKSVRARQ